MTAAHRNLPIRNLPGVDPYGEDYSESQDGNYEDNPWVERDADGNPRNEDRGLVEEFFDDLFGRREPRTSAPLPPPPPPPPVAPRPSPEVEDSADPPSDEPGPYRQPEPDPEESSPF
jgi:hypothetical protein